MLMETNCSLLMTYSLLKYIVSESLIRSHISWVFIQVPALSELCGPLIYLMDVQNAGDGFSMPKYGFNPTYQISAG